MRVDFLLLSAFRDARLNGIIIAGGIDCCAIFFSISELKASF